MSARRCPNCHKMEMYVIGTYLRERGLPSIGINHAVRRRRLECENCGKRFTTYEVDERDIENIKNELHGVKKRARLSMTVMGRLETAIRHCKEDLVRVAGTDKPMDARYINGNKPRT